MEIIFNYLKYPYYVPFNLHCKVFILCSTNVPTHTMAIMATFEHNGHASARTHCSLLSHIFWQCISLPNIEQVSLNYLRFCFLSARPSSQTLPPSRTRTNINVFRHPFLSFFVVGGERRSVLVAAAVLQNEFNFNGIPFTHFATMIKCVIVFISKICSFVRFIYYYFLFAIFSSLSSSSSRSYRCKTAEKSSWCETMNSVKIGRKSERNKKEKKEKILCKRCTGATVRRVQLNEWNYRCRWNCAKKTNAQRLWIGISSSLPHRKRFGFFNVAPMRTLMLESFE